MTRNLLLSTAVIALSADFAYAGNFGLEVIGDAVVSYRSNGNLIVQPTNEVTFTILPPRVTPTIEFFRHSPNAVSAVNVKMNGAMYSPSGDLNGPFLSIDIPQTLPQPIDLSAPIPLAPADAFLSGELMFLKTEFLTANINSLQIDKTSVVVESATGDLMTVQMFESGPDTGEFWAYMPSSTQAPIINDSTLSTASNSQITARISANNIQAEIITDTVFVNPLNMVFDSVTGGAVSGAVIELIDLDTGELASVFGVDGVSGFPAIVESGSVVQDQSGLVYENENGIFCFPYLQPGNYAVRVTPPEGYSFASILPPEQIDAMTGAGFFLTDASYGKTYSLEEAGPLRFDIPLDPNSNISLTKTADSSSADVGDYVNYTVTIENKGNASIPVNLYDVLPLGFRYVPGTALIADSLTADPTVSQTGTELTFPMGIISPNTSINLDYMLEVGPGGFASGDAVNQAVVLDGGGAPISNVARASIKFREDLLRSRSTIVGRVTEQSCDGGDRWARKLRKGIGVEGVRLYMETGAYAVTDASGLYHFEGIKSGTHVVQVDQDTLPAGFELMVCEENTRYAGSASSMFVDVQGGGIWRSNFYLKRTPDALADEALETEEVFNDATDYKTYDQAWLDRQDKTVEWVYPETTRTPSKPSVNIGIKHPVGASIDLYLNGNLVSPYNLSARDRNTNGTAMISRWRGVDILKGENAFTAVVRGADKKIIKTLQSDVAYVETIARAHGVPGRSRPVADGRTIPRLAIRLEDEAGRPVHAGRVAKISVAAPYRLYDETERRDVEAQSSDLIAPLGAQSNIFVGPDGIVDVKLEPTLVTGKATVNVTLDNGRIIPITTYLEPEKRDWVIVGLAEGSVGYKTISDKARSLNVSDSDTVSDGRVAFFAKGLIKGNWLLTAALDTNKRRGGRDGDFLNEIDPNAYYTLYGDRSYQETEARSRYPLYIKLEKRSASALFGDYNTRMNEARLATYNRELSGLKAEYVGETFEAMAFAAETNQGFAKDELAANGTSGTYQLSHTNILAQSETIAVETRDRDRPDIVLERRELVRFIDYTLDYLTGELIFSFPVAVSDADFNPNVIIADYETAEDAERNVTFGGRLETKLLGDKIKLGASFVSENGNSLAAGSKQTLIGTDAVVQVTDDTEIRLEYARTENANSAVKSSEAMLAEIVHTSENLTAEAFFREEEGGFGLGQSNSNTNDVRRYGASANFKFNEFEDSKTGRRGSQTIQGTAFHEDNLSTGDSRDTVEVRVRHQGERLSLASGLRAAKDNFVARDDRESILAIAQASLSVPKHGAVFQVTHEQPLGGQDEVSSNPQRTAFTLDKTLGKNVTANLRHEILKGATTDAQNTAIGLSVTPWKGSVLTASADHITNDSSRRIGGTLGLDQQVRLSDKWSASTGLRNRRILNQNGDFVQVAPDAAVSPLETNEGFTSAYVGVGYRSDAMAASTRIEARTGSDGDTWIATASAARELSQTLSVAGALRGSTQNRNTAAQSSNQVDARVGTAWRPRDNGLIVFNRFDYGSQKDELGKTRVKFVNNIAANTYVNERWQVSANHGIKYVRDDTGAKKVSNVTNLFGFETRVDVTKRIDIGLRGSMLVNDKGQTSYGYGPSLGLSPVKNVWIGAGYNVEGYTDRDFEAAEYSRKGAYLQLRIKFDQDTARGLLRRISPSANAVN